jgi:autotransporter-associated beta strand protein
MNFGGDGFGFPAPYNSGGANFESFYSGKVDIATPGTYTFNTSSDDGSMLFIDGQVVVQNNFFQGVATRTGSIYLAAGMHDIVIAFNQGGGGYGMNAQMSGPDNTTMVDINTSNASITPDLVVGSLAGEGNVALTTGNLLMGIDNSSTDFSGAISGIGGVTKFGSGVQTLSGANTYSGATTISAGTLRIDGNSSGALGALTVEAGAFLGGTGSYGGNITLKDGSGMSAELNLTDCTLTCGGQLSFSNLDFAHCTFTVGTGAGYPPYRTFTLIEAASLGTVTFTNAEGMIDGVPAKLYINDNKLMLRVGRQGTYVSFF